jgi:O-antigen/teichoic acid export membrane protein/glycosyltransferase involved in cell wall biosynthesis
MARTSDELDRSLIHGLAWTGAIRWIGQLASWAITIIVARLLSPADYGLVGMAGVYVGFTQLLCEAGLVAALLHRRDSDTVAYAQLGGFSALLGLGCTIVSFALAYPLAAAYGEPAVRPIIQMLGLGFLARGVQVLPRGLLARDLDFRRLAWIDGIEALSLSAFTFVLAVNGAGVWSLVIGNLLGGVVGAVLSFRWRPHPLAWPRDLRAIASDVSFGSKVLGGQLAWYIYSNSDFAIVGRALGSQALGAYTLGWTLANVPVDRVSSLVTRVTPAYFAALSDDREGLRRYLERISEGLAAITFPACVGLALVADDLVATMLGPTWTPAILPLRLLALVATIRSVFVLAPPILVFTGQVRRNLWFSISCAIVMPLVFLVAARWGIVGIAVAWMLVYPLFAAIFMFRHALRAVGMSWWAYLRALSTPLVATAVMSGAVIAFRAWEGAPPQGIRRLIEASVLGGVAYLVAILLLAGNRIREIISLFRGRGAPARERNKGQRRALVVSYHFPPDPAVGGLRWQKLAQFAVARGWRVDVMSLDPAALSRQDPGRLAELPPEVVVHHVPLPPATPLEWPARLWQWWRRRVSTRTTASGSGRALARPASLAARDLRWWPVSRRDLSRAYFAWIDRQRGMRWGAAAAARAHGLAAITPYDVVISCGPPHPTHPPIAAFADATRTPLVLDLRDPWSLLQRLPESVASPLWSASARRDEQRVIRGAALTVTATGSHRDRLRALYPAHASRIIAIRNGCDDDPIPPPTPDPRFVIGYAGSVYLDRDPLPLFRAAARLVREEHLRPEEFGIEFMGEVTIHDGVPLTELARRAGIGEFLWIHAPRPRAEALAFLARSSMLVLLPQDSDLAIPAKLYEYVRFRAWLLALATRESATGQLLAGTAAHLVDPDDDDGIYRALAAAFAAHRRDEAPPVLAMDHRFHRAEQAGALFDAVEALLSERVPAPAVLTAPVAAAEGSRG